MEGDGFVMLMKENRARVYAFTVNPGFPDFMKRFYMMLERKADELGYAFKDIDVPSATMSPTGTLILEVRPKIDSEPIRPLAESSAIEDQGGNASDINRQPDVPMPDAPGAGV